MEGALVLILILLVLGWLYAHGHDPYARVREKVRESNQDDSYVSYRNAYGQRSVHRDTCRGCAMNEAVELQRAGYQIDEVVVGRRDSGQL